MLYISICAKLITQTLKVAPLWGTTLRVWAWNQLCTNTYRRSKNRFIQRFALKNKPRNFLKALLCKAFKKFLVVRLIGNGCKCEPQGDTHLFTKKLFLMKYGNHRTLDEQIFDVQFVLSIFLLCMAASCTRRRNIKNKSWLGAMATTMGAIDSTSTRHCHGWCDRKWRNL